MAQQILTYIYGHNNYDLNKFSGVGQTFPTQGVRFESISPAVQFSGVDCNSKIIVLPTGLTVNANEYYTPTLVSSLLAAANA